MKFGIRFETTKRRFVFAIDREYFSWTPGEVESGMSSPGEFFDCYTDKYNLWSFLCFAFYYARVLA